MELLHEIGQFQPQTADERDAKDRLLALLKQYGERLLERDCEAGHITCSAFILSPDMQETLMAYHLVYQSVGWLGGHADGEKASAAAVGYLETYCKGHGRWPFPLT